MTIRHPLIYVRRAVHLVITYGLLVALYAFWQLLEGNIPTASQYELYFAFASIIAAGGITLDKIIVWRDE